MSIDRPSLYRLTVQRCYIQPRTTKVVCNNYTVGDMYAVTAKNQSANWAVSALLLIVALLGLRPAALCCDEADARCADNAFAISVAFTTFNQTTLQPDCYCCVTSHNHSLLPQAATHTPSPNNLGVLPEASRYAFGQPERTSARETESQLFISENSAQLPSWRAPPVLN